MPQTPTSEGRLPGQVLSGRRLNAAETKMLRLATLKAVQAMPYLATALYQVQPVAVPGLNTFAVDVRWRLLVDLDHAATHWTLGEQAAVLLHEVNHVLRDHHGRADRHQATDARRWNIAGDACINDDMASLAGAPNGVALPPEAIRSAALGMRAGLPVEVIYDLLSSSDPQTDLGTLPVGTAAAPSGSGPASSGSCDGTDASSQVAAASAEDEGEGGNGIPRCGDGAGGLPLPVEGIGDVADGVTPGVARTARRKVAHDISNAAAARAARRGVVPAGLRRWAATELAPPKIDWRRVLASSIRRSLSTAAGRQDHTYSRPSRRRVARVVLPAMQRPRPRVITVLDTSGSMDERRLETALAEINGICTRAGLRGRDHQVVCVDAEAGELQPVRTAGDLQLQGGGGTDMGRGLHVAARQRARPDLTIVLTDGATPWPAAPPGAIPVIIGLIDAHPNVPRPDWAQIVDITEERTS